MPKIRLDKLISNNLNISRKQTASDIRHGLVAVNGEIVRTSSILLNPEEDKVFYKDKQVVYKKYIYILMNKPAGVLSASTDKSRETVIDLLPKEMRRSGLFPVGRLDKDTTGLLLITDDGEFAHNCISPKKNIIKTYLVTLDGNLQKDMVSAFKSGIILADGTKCKPADLEIIKTNLARVTISEGKYHQIKRMFGAVGLGVNALHREAIGLLKIPENISSGSCLELNFDELTNLVINNTQNSE